MHCCSNCIWSNREVTKALQTGKRFLIVKRQRQLPSDWRHCDQRAGQAPNSKHKRCHAVRSSDRFCFGNVRVILNHNQRCVQQIFSATTLQYRLGTLACGFLSRRPAPERAVELIEQRQTHLWSTKCGGQPIVVQRSQSGIAGRNGQLQHMIVTR
jgi:hypothetical protein